MEVFICWSGDLSKKLGEAIRDWLPAVMQAVKPYFTPEDVEKGARWNSEIAKHLESAEIGLLCISRENIHNDWILFEAGALSKSLEKGYVNPILFGISDTDLSGPLKQFQATKFDKQDFKKLVSLINDKLGDSKLEIGILDAVYDKWWPDLETKVNNIYEEHQSDQSEQPIREDRELLDEILVLTRNISKDIIRKENHAIKHDYRDNLGFYGLLMSKILNLSEKLVVADGSYQDILDRMKEIRDIVIDMASSYVGENDRFDILHKKLIRANFKFIGKQPEDEDLPF